MTAASMATERQSLETGILDSQTILMANSTVWCCFLGVHTMANGTTQTVTQKKPSFATMVSFPTL